MGAIVGMLLVTAGMVAIAIVVWGKLQRQEAGDDTFEDKLKADDERARIGRERRAAAMHAREQAKNGDAATTAGTVGLATGPDAAHGRHDAHHGQEHGHNGDGGVDVGGADGGDSGGGDGGGGDGGDSGGGGDGGGGGD